MLIVLALLAAGVPVRTFRVDYVHSGTASEERFALERLVLEPLPWPGNPDRTVDDTDSGKYLFEVRDRGSARLLYSRGFSSIYGEWETTAEAKHVPRAFGESLRFPFPAAPVQIVVKKRDPRSNLFRDAWTLAFDPRDPAVDDSPPPPAGEVIALQRSGDPSRKVDLLLLGDGYTARERVWAQKPLDCSRQPLRLSQRVRSASIPSHSVPSWRSPITSQRSPSGASTRRHSRPKPTARSRA